MSGVLRREIEGNHFSDLVRGHAGIDFCLDGAERRIEEIFSGSAGEGCSAYHTAIGPASEPDRCRAPSEPGGFGRNGPCRSDEALGCSQLSVFYCEDVLEADEVGDESRDGSVVYLLRCADLLDTTIQHHDGWRRGIFAHTSPIYVAVGGEYSLFDRVTAEYMLTLIEGSLEHIHNRAAHYGEGTVTHHHGEADHLAYLERPFREAIEAIHRRMHQMGIAH